MYAIEAAEAVADQIKSKRRNGVTGSVIVNARSADDSINTNIATRSLVSIVWSGKDYRNSEGDLREGAFEILHRAQDGTPFAISNLRSGLLPFVNGK